MVDVKVNNRVIIEIIRIILFKGFVFCCDYKNVFVRCKVIKIMVE